MQDQVEGIPVHLSILQSACFDQRDASQDGRRGRDTQIMIYKTPPNPPRFTTYTCAKSSATITSRTGQVTKEAKLNSVLSARCTREDLKLDHNPTFCIQLTEKAFPLGRAAKLSCHFIYDCQVAPLTALSCANSGNETSQAMLQKHDGFHALINDGGS